MTVLLLERVSPSVRGDLTRWLLELRAGVFVGQLAASVREKLWERTCAGVEGGGAIMIHAANTEQGFTIRLYGDPRREVVDFDGLMLVRTLPSMHEPVPSS